MQIRRVANVVLSTTLSVIMTFALVPCAAFATELTDDPADAPAVTEEGASPASDDSTLDPTQSIAQEPAENPILDNASPNAEAVEPPAIEPGDEVVDVEEEPELKQQSVQVEEVVPEVAGDVGVVAQDAKSTAGDAVSTQAEGATVSGAAHIQGVGWSRVGAADSVVLGAAGKGRRLEALKLQVGRPDGVSGGIRYRTHAQKVGWQGWASDGGSAGTVGKSLRLEALRIELTGELSAKYDIYDDAAFNANPMPFYVVCTDVTTGRAVYRRLDEATPLAYDWIRASASMPLCSKVVELEGYKLLDGGTARWWCGRLHSLGVSREHRLRAQCGDSHPARGLRQGAQPSDAAHATGPAQVSPDD